MTLLDQYKVAVDVGSFAHRVSAALWEKSLTELAALTFTEPPTDKQKREARAIRDILLASTASISPVVRLLASADLSDTSTDVQIQAAVDGNWDKIVLLFDPTLDAPVTP